MNRPFQFSIFALLGLMALVGAVIAFSPVIELLSLLVVVLMLSSIYAFESSIPKAIKSDPVSIFLIGFLLIVLYFGIRVSGLI